MAKIQYLNTDLDLHSEQDLRPLAEELKRRGLIVLHVTEGKTVKWTASFEATTQLSDADSSIRAMLEAIEALQGDSLELWKTCSFREFNAGYDCGDEPYGFSDGLSNETLRRLSAIGASLRLTLYPPSE